MIFDFVIKAAVVLAWAGLFYGAWDAYRQGWVREYGWGAAFLWGVLNMVMFAGAVFILIFAVDLTLGVLRA